MNGLTAKLVLFLMLFWASGSMSPAFHNHFHRHYGHEIHDSITETHFTMERQYSADSETCITCHLINFFKGPSLGSFPKLYSTPLIVTSVPELADLSAPTMFRGPGKPRAPPAE